MEFVAALRATDSTLSIPITLIVTPLRAPPKCERLHLSSPATGLITLSSRESFDNIYLDLSKQHGKCKLAESGLGWKPSGGGETFTLDSSNIGAAQWSRAAKGYELKILSRSSGVIQLDGFDQEVCPGISLSDVNMREEAVLIFAAVDARTSSD